MALFTKESKAEQDLKWAWIWFKKMASFHGKQPDKSRVFTSAELKAFLRSKRAQNVPGWKRMKIIEAAIVFRRVVQNLPVDDLIPVQRQLLEYIAEERAKNEGYDSIEDAVGLIDPSEVDAIQAFRRAMRKAGLSLETEKAYVGKVKAFMEDRALKTLADFDRIGPSDVEAHLTDLAVDGNVSPSTQNGAFFALLKFFEIVLKRDMGRIEAIRASKGKQIPTVLDEKEVGQVFEGLSGVHLVIAKLLYGCGMRISETLRLRIKDIDFANQQIEIHQSKGGKSRLVPMPDDLVKPLRRWFLSRQVLHEHDLAEGTASVWLPHALGKKYPSAHREFRWQYLFASSRLSKDPRTGALHRHHLHKDTFPKNLRAAVESAGLTKHITSHTFRHCFATHLLWAGTDIRQIQQLLGHSDVKTTEIYTHVRNPKESKVVSPLDRMLLNAS